MYKNIFLYCTAKGLSLNSINLNVVRCKTRWHRRSPTTVILPFNPNLKPNLKTENVIDLTSVKKKNNEENQEMSIEKFPEKKRNNNNPEIFKKIKDNRESRLQIRKSYLSQKRVFDDNGVLLYEKIQDNDSRISSMILKLKSKKERARSKQILVEGWRMIADGLQANCNLHYVIFSEIEMLKKIEPYLPKVGVKLYKIKYEDMKLLSDVKTPPGIFGIFVKPSEKNIKLRDVSLPIHLICDNIRVPDNLGAILRSAVGCGLEKILLTKGCVDIWDSKVIRSAAGAHFRQPVVSCLEHDDICKYLPENTSVFIADTSRIPNEDDVCDDKKSILPIVPYYSINYGNLKHLTLIVGGETEGISEESYRLAEKFNGLRVNIPLQKDFDSLNTAMASAIIMFEMKKQLTHEKEKHRKEREEISLNCT